MSKETKESLQTEHTSTGRFAILKCDCNHNFQDKNFGKGMRVHTLLKQTPGSEQIYRCTVCSKEKTKAGKNRGKK